MTYLGMLRLSKRAMKAEENEKYNDNNNDG
jgi:hypothetical protein